jgi:hypothetical protein
MRGACDFSLLPRKKSFPYLLTIFKTDPIAHALPGVAAVPVFKFDENGPL